MLYWVRYKLFLCAWAPTKELFMAIPKKISGYGLTQAIYSAAPNPIIAKRNPAAQDQAPLGTVWVNTSNNNIWILTSVGPAGGVWSGGTGGAGVFATLTSVTTTTVGTSLAVGTNATIGGNIGVTGNGTIGGTLGVTGLATLGSAALGNTAVVGTFTQTAGAVSIGGDAAANNISIGTGAAGKTIDIGNNTAGTQVNISSAAAGINIGVDAVAIPITIGNITGATAVLINSGTNGTTIATTNGVFDVTTGTGAINIGTDAVAHTVTVGNASGATSVVLNVGTGNLHLGTTATDHTTAVGSQTGVSQTTIQGGTAGIDLVAPFVAYGPGGGAAVKLYTGVGAPANALAVEAGDIYVRQDPGNANERIYISTAPNTWTNVTCAA